MAYILLSCEVVLTFSLHPAISLALSFRTLKCSLSPLLLEVPCFSSCFLVWLFFHQYDFPVCNLLLGVVFHIRSTSSWLPLIYQPTLLCLLQFLHCQETLYFCILLLPLILTGIPREMLWLYVPRKTRTCFCCSHSILRWESFSSWVRIKLFTVKYEAV